MPTKQGKCVTLSNVFDHWFRYQSSCCFQQSGFITHPQISSTIIRELFIYSLEQFSVIYVVDWLSHKWVTQHVKQLIGFHRTWQSLVLDRFTCRDLKSFSYTQCCSFRHLLIFITVRLWFNNCVSILIEFALELQCEQRRIRSEAELCVVWNFGHKNCWNLKTRIENYGLEMCVKKYAIVLSSVCSLTHRNYDNTIFSDNGPNNSRILTEVLLSLWNWVISILRRLRYALIIL